MPYFESITTDKGGIPWMLRPKSDYPCGEHFKTVNEWAALSTTAPLLGILEKYNIEIPWMQKAEQFVWQEIERIKEKHVFCHLCVPTPVILEATTPASEIRLDSFKALLVKP